MRILLIDDDMVDRAMVRRALNRSGLEVELVEASDGLTGLRIAGEQPFDCVLLDYRLPDMDAFDVLKGLLADTQRDHTVLMLTGEADQDIAYRLMGAGALDYLSKADTTPENLTRSIRYALARRTFLSELEAARREAEEKSRALDSLNQQKNLLFSIIAHDLRNPFQGLLNAATILNRAVAKNDIEAVTKRAEAVEQAANQAYVLMESLFSWATLQMDNAEVVKDDLELSKIVNEVLAVAAQAIQSKGLILQSECSGLRLRAHRDMLIAVLRNLISNAIKFTPKGGTISVFARQSEDAIEISIEDTGVGMSEERVRDIFRIDQRMTTEGTAGEKGSGLGLLLCRDLAERQGAKLVVESTLGSGTIFRLKFPRATL